MRGDRGSEEKKTAEWKCAGEGGGLRVLEVRRKILQDIKGLTWS